jgi:ABC-type Co2+ transport system permease subunit
VENRGGILNSTGLGIMQTKRNILFITRTAILMALTLVIQMMNLPQYATGPLVNTMLYVAAVFVGVWGGVAIGLIGVTFTVLILGMIFKI